MKDLFTEAAEWVESNDIETIVEGDSSDLSKHTVSFQEYELKIILAALEKIKDNKKYSKKINYIINKISRETKLKSFGTQEWHDLGF